MLLKNPGYHSQTLTVKVRIDMCWLLVVIYRQLVREWSKKEVE